MAPSRILTNNWTGCFVKKTSAVIGIMTMCGATSAFAMDNMMNKAGAISRM